MVGLAGTADMRVVLEAEATGDEEAVLAVGVYLHRLRAGISAMAAAMGGLDALTFTGGVGEHAAAVRSRSVSDLAFSGLAIDEEVNAAADGDVELTGSGATVRSFVVSSREDLEIAREVRGLLEPSGGSA